MWIVNFEELTFWIKWKDLAIEIYKIFTKNNDFWFRDQIQRAWLSISNNIAEWFERKWNKEFKRFLYIAKGSCWEVRSMLIIAKELWYIDNHKFLELYEQSQEISKMLSWFIKSLKE